MADKAKEKAILEKAILEKAILEKAILEKAILEKAILEKAISDLADDLKISDFSKPVAIVEPDPCPCREARGFIDGWCSVAGGGVPGCEH